MTSEEIIVQIVDRFQGLYSDKYRDPRRLISIANPERKEELLKSTKHSFKPKINKASKIKDRHLQTKILDKLNETNASILSQQSASASSKNNHSKTE